MGRVMAKSSARKAKDRGYSFEMRVANKLGGDRSVLSRYGDVHARGFVIETKHQTGAYGLAKLKKWIDKAKEDATKYGDGKWALALTFGGRSGNYVVIDLDEFEKLTRGDIEEPTDIHERQDDRSSEP